MINTILAIMHDGDVQLTFSIIFTIVFVVVMYFLTEKPVDKSEKR